MLMVEKNFIPISFTSLLNQLSYVANTSCIGLHCPADVEVFGVFFSTSNQFSNTSPCNIKFIHVQRSFSCILNEQVQNSVALSRCISNHLVVKGCGIFYSGLLCQFTCPFFIRPNYKHPKGLLEEKRKV